MSWGIRLLIYRGGGRRGRQQKGRKRPINRGKTSKRDPEQGRGKEPYSAQQPQQQTLFRHSSATFLPQAFQQPQQQAPAATEYILTTPETQMPGTQVIQQAQQSQVATKGKQQPRWKPISFIVVDDKQPRPSTRITFIQSPMKHFNPPSVAPATGKENQHIRTLKLL